MFDRILVPLDGSTLAECAIPHALTLSQVFGSEILLVSVLNGSESGQHGPIDPVEWQVQRAEMESYLRGVIRRIRDAGFEAAWRVVEGSPADCIVDTTRTDAIDLVLLSTHGATGRSRWTFGSVVRKVLQCANISVMIVRAFSGEPSGETAPAIYRRLLLPLDGSQRAECVLPLATRIAEFHEAEIHVVHAIARPEMACRCPLSDDDLDLERRFLERNRQTANEYLGNIRSRLPASAQTSLVVGDDAVVSLHEAAESANPDLVILSAHGYTGQRKWPFGTVSRSFLEYGTMTLLVLQDFNRSELEAAPAELVAQEHRGH